MNESFIGAPPMKEKIKWFGYSVQEMTHFNILILMQIENADFGCFLLMTCNLNLLNL